MRLAQRIGRLYRYGQKRHVMAFNLQGLESADELIVSKMYERLEQVARDMSSVDSATSEDLVSDIVGELAGLLDIEGILEEARESGVKRTQERIEEALARAKQSAALQRDLFQHAVSYDANELQGAFPVRLDHLRAFVFGMVSLFGGSVSESRLHPGRAWRLTLSDQIVAALPGQARELRVTFDRQLEDAQSTLLDLDHPLVRFLVECATDYDFQGLTAPIELSGSANLVTAMLRWQDDRGRRLRQEYVAVAIDEDRATELNPAAFSEWLLSPADVSEAPPARERDRQAQMAADARLEAVLAQRSNLSLHPENLDWVTAAWCSAPVA